MLMADFETILKESKKKNDDSINKIRNYSKKFSDKIKEIISVL